MLSKVSCHSRPDGQLGRAGILQSPRQMLRDDNSVTTALRGLGNDLPTRSVIVASPYRDLLLYEIYLI